LQTRGLVVEQVVDRDPAAETHTSRLPSWKPVGPSAVSSPGGTSPDSPPSRRSASTPGMPAQSRGLTSNGKGNDHVEHGERSERASDAGQRPFPRQSRGWGQTSRAVRRVLCPGTSRSSGRRPSI
jgi:hypothetical protein